MNRLPTILCTTALAVGLAACTNSATTTDGPSAGAPSNGDGATAAPAPATGSTWKAGDTIPSGRPGVPDVRIVEVRANGDGEVCGVGRTATLAYTAMLANGQVIDPGTRPFTFTVGAREAIEGWDLIVQRMRVGDDFTVVVPQQLAYGPSRGDLKFHMELLSFR